MTDDRHTGALVNKTDGAKLPAKHIRGIEGSHGTVRDFPVWQKEMGAVMQDIGELRSGEQLTHHHLENMHVMVYPGDDFFKQATAQIRKEWP